MMHIRTTLDLFASLTLCTSVSIALVFYSHAVWAVFGLGMMWAAKTLHKSANMTSSAVKWESGFTDWFIVLKSVTSAAGVILMNIFRQYGWYTINTHMITLGFLDLNILEAMVREYELGFYSNAIVAVGLMCTIPFSLTPETILSLGNETIQSRLFFSPLSLPWILLYTSWNACFSYGDNMSWQTRLILVPPILIASYYDVKLWLGARVLLLLLHLILRAIQAVWFYQPGHSFLTPVAGSIRNSRFICLVWGHINLVVFCLYAIILYPNQ
jgi:hypothetical protein